MHEAVSEHALLMGVSKARATRLLDGQRNVTVQHLLVGRRKNALVPCSRTRTLSYMHMGYRTVLGCQLNCQVCFKEPPYPVGT